MVEDVEVAAEAEEVRVRLAMRDGTELRCPDCRKTAPGYDQAAERGWRHLDACQYQTVLVARIPRVECPEHGVRQILVPWPEERSRFTTLFEAWAIRTVVSDLERDRLLWVGDERKKTTLAAYWSQLPEAHLAGVTEVVMDMWEPYIRATLDAVPDADSKIVIGCYHVAHLLTDGIDRVRRAEQTVLRSQGDARLIGTRFIWIKGPAKRRPSEELQIHKLSRAGLKVGRAWALKYFKHWYYWAQPAEADDPGRQDDEALSPSRPLLRWRPPDEPTLIPEEPQGIAAVTENGEGRALRSRSPLSPRSRIPKSLDSGSRRSRITGERMIRARQGCCAERGRGWSITVLTAGLVLVVSACDAGSGGETQGNTGPLTFTTSDIRVLGGSDAIAQVNDLEVLPDGSVWLLNSVQPFFIGLDPSGAVLGTHGTSGGGPEEFRMPSGFVTGGLGDEAWVLDFIRHALIKVSQPDEPWSQVSVPQDAVPPGSLRGGMDMMSPGVRTARLGEEVILPRTTGSMDSGIFSFRMAILGADLVAFHPGTGAVRQLVSLRDALEDPATGFEATEGGFPLWYRLWAVCGGDQIRVYDRVSNQLRGFDGEGNELEAIDLPPVSLTEVTPRQFARAVFGLRQAEVTGAVGSRLSTSDSLRVINEMIQGIKGEPRQLAGYLPRYIDFRCADDGTMWMHPLDLEVGGLKGGLVWLRVSPDGIIREVHLPGRFDVLRFTSSRIWGVQRDAFDVASVAWIEVP